MTWLKILGISLLIGNLTCCSIPIKVKISYPILSPKFIHIKNGKEVIIKAMVKESRLTQSDATILWEKYKCSEIKGFVDYLIKINPFGLQDRYYIDFVQRVKARTKILKRGYYER